MRIPKRLGPGFVVSHILKTNGILPGFRHIQATKSMVYHPNPTGLGVLGCASAPTAPVHAELAVSRSTAGTPGTLGPSSTIPTEMGFLGSAPRWW